MIKAAIIGASGYSGAEIVKILTGHSGAEVSVITSSRFAGKSLSDFYPNLTGMSDLKLTAYTPDLAKEVDVVFLALPHGKAMEFVPELKKVGALKIIDISGDFRLPSKVYESWYKKAHSSPELIDGAVYGLSEINRDSIAGAELVANPGCFPTAVILALAPLLTMGVDDGTIVANCLSGVSGAGRALSDAVHFSRVDNNVFAYKVGGAHQHIPEMEQALAKLARTEPKLVFTPQLGPFSRGIYATITVPVAKDIHLEKLRVFYHDFYTDKKFVKVLPEETFPELKAVRGSNYCHIGLAVDKRAGQVVIISAIDNLVKGAAGQAVQNMNLMFGLDESTGLTQPGLYP